MTVGAERAAVFLDRDGVINEVVFRGGKPASPRSLEEFVLTEEIEASVARLGEAGFPVYVCTNQPDVARDLLDAAELDRMHDHLRARLPVDEVVACTHDNHHDCACRKPKPGMLTELAERHGVSLARSFFIGDSHKDMDAGRAAGVVTILLRRDYNTQASGDVEVTRLAEAVEHILAAAGR